MVKTFKIARCWAITDKNWTLKINEYPFSKKISWNRIAMQVVLLNTTWKVDALQNNLYSFGSLDFLIPPTGHLK